MSLRLPGLHFGVMRSPLRSAAAVLPLADAIAASPHLRLDGIMGYEAQIAGLGDRVPGQTAKNLAVRVLQQRSRAAVARLRTAVVAALRERGMPLRFVNGGGTGSIESTIREPDVSEVLVCSETERPEILRAAQVSLGALGIIASITLRLVPTYHLEYVWQPETLSGCLDQLGHSTAANRNFEFYWLPHTDTVMTKRMNISQRAAHSQVRHTLRHYQELVLENSVLWLISEVCRHFPATAPLASGLLAGLISSGKDINASHKIFATPRLVKFQEMEYSLPVETMAVALEAIDRSIRRQRFQVHFPLECRVVRGDTIDLSPASGRDSAYIAVHMYKGMAYREYFAALEAILRSYGGRPHWGKLHTLTARELAPLYPRWDHFQAVRASLDPAGVLLNPYLRSILGVSA